MNNLTKYLITAFIAVMMSLSSATKAGISDSKVYSDPAGQIYLEAPKSFVLIAAEVNIPLLISPKSGYLKVVRSGAGWVIEVVTAAQWAALSLSSGHPSVSAVRVLANSSVLLIMANQNVPALLIGGFDALPTVIAANADGSAYIRRKVTYIHTDFLGSVVAETDESGTVIKKTEYKPFGDSKDN